YKSNMYGKLPGLYHQYVIEASLDGKNWEPIVDRSENKKDVPNDYVALDTPIKARFIRYQNIHVPTPYLSLSDIRIFGTGYGKAPKMVKGLTVVRNDKRRGAEISWKPLKNAQGYNVLWGIAPDKLYSSWLVYGENALQLKSLNTDQAYYFAVEAFNENGVSEKSPVTEVD
ncbi:MAG TPA: discoidin domain-containing protein, partial [Pricia sp.]|nr:discoidin domain-containing protein [Pricia sp.]